jgi:PTS system, glucose subfamily, IIA component
MTERVFKNKEMFGFKKKIELPTNAFAAVASGNLLPLSKVNDPVFAEKMMGEGLAIDINDDYIVAPCNGEITMLYPTLHAFGITNEEGVNVLVHIGIDTVALKGKGFKAYVSKGDKVRVGDKLIKVDTYELRNKNVDLTTMMLFPDNNKKINIIDSGSVKKGSTIVVTYE